MNLINMNLINMNLINAVRESLAARFAAITLPIAAFLLSNPAQALAIEINEDFKPQNEFKLDPWVELKFGPVDMSINKAVLLLVLAGAATIGVLLYIANRMQARPNRVQFVVEMAYDLIENVITKANIKNSVTANKWFGFLATLFFFIWFSNILGYLPLPINTEHTVNIFGWDAPTFQIYAATANLSVPLALALVVWISYHFEGVREHGPIGYLKTWAPSGLKGPVKVAVFAIESLSHFLRLISLSVRLFANMLAGHMLILIMGGGMIVLLGTIIIAPLTLPIGVAFFIFEVGLIASLQAFIFAILSAIYLGSAVSHDH
ncbi:MAG: F0F1 ATP synthase subunit A [Solirubrobacterales bacterium]